MPPANRNIHRSPLETTPKWIPLSYSLGLMFRHKRLLGLSLLLFCLMIIFTWLGYTLAIEYVNDFTGNYINNEPSTATIWGWLKYSGWLVGKWLLLVISRIVAFYLSFLLAYSLTSPGYVFLSTVAEKLHLAEHFQAEDAFSLKGTFTDLIEGVKIGIYGLLVTMAALLVNFIPVIGQAVILLLYTYYSTLMFIDYPASRRRWRLGQKIHWISSHGRISFRLGILPAVVSMIPLVNIFLMACLFPLLTIHTTLNFSNLLSLETLPQARGGRDNGY